LPPSDIPLEKRGRLFYEWQRWLLVCTMQEDCKTPPFEAGTSQVVIALLQALLFLRGFVEWNCNVATPFSINSTTMLPLLV